MRALSPDQREQCFSRMKQEKYIHLEGGAVGSHQSAMDVVRRNALPKLTVHCPNLVIVVDDLKVTPVGLPGLADFVTRGSLLRITTRTILMMFALMNGWAACCSFIWRQKATRRLITAATLCRIRRLCLPAPCLHR